MKRRNKISLIFLIVLLVIFLPLAIYGFIYRLQTNYYDENSNHLLYFKDSIWFYDNGNLLYKYDCKNKNCELLRSIIDEKDLKVNYFKKGVIKKLSLINNKYAFISDGEEAFIFDLEKNSSIMPIKNIKNYDTNLEGNLFIVENSSGKWGVIRLNDSLEQVIPFNYDFIGLNNRLDLGIFQVKSGDDYYIINSNDQVLTSSFDKIMYDFTNDVVLIRDTNYEIYDYNLNKYLENIKISNIEFIKDYIIVYTTSNVLIYNDIKGASLKEVNTYGKSNINVEYEENKINIKEGDNVIDYLEIN